MNNSRCVAIKICKHTDHLFRKTKKTQLAVPVETVVIIREEEKGLQKLDSAKLVGSVLRKYWWAQQNLHMNKGSITYHNLRNKNYVG